MNWTGGRLRRQSQNPGSVSRIQKQYFARARLKQREASTNFAIHAAPFSRINNQLTGDYDGSDDHIRTAHGANDRNREEVAQRPPWWRHHTQERDPSPRRQGGVEVLSSSQALRTPNAGLPTSGIHHVEAETSPRVSELENIKLRLLHQDDWAGISATRPLQMRFTSVEEKENVGKRRKIMTDDREGRRAGSQRLAALEMCPGRNKNRHKGNVMQDNMRDYININVNKHSSRKPLGPNGPRLARRQQSSDSMLLDGEETSFTHRSLRALGETSAGIQKSELHIMSDSVDSENTMMITSDHGINKSHADLFMDNADIYQMDPFESSPKPIASSPQNPNENISPTPSNLRLRVRNRFTLDDQILAIRGNELESSLTHTGLRNPYNVQICESAGQFSHEPSVYAQDGPGLGLASSPWRRIINISNSGITHAESSPFNQEDVGWLPHNLLSEQAEKNSQAFVTPDQKSTWIRNRESQDAALDIQDRLDREMRTQPPMLFGQSMPLSSRVEEVYTPSRSVRPVDRRRESFAERTIFNQEQNLSEEFDSIPPDMLPYTSDADSGRSIPNISGQLSVHEAPKVAANIHCNPNRTIFHSSNRTIRSPSLYTEANINERHSTTTITQPKAHASPSSCLSSAPRFRFPACWTPQRQEAPSAAVASSPQLPMQPSPRLSPALSFTFGRRINPPESRETPVRSEPAISNDGHDTHSPENTTQILPFFNTPFRR